MQERRGVTCASRAPAAPSCMLSRSIPRESSQGRQEERPHLRGQRQQADESSGVGAGGCGKG